MARGNGDGNGKDPMLGALHDVVAELRGFREDTNARFREADTRMQRVESVLLETRQEARETNAKLGSVDARLGRVEVRLESVDDRLGRVEVRLESVDDRLGRVGVRLESVDARLGNVEGGLADLCAEVHEGFSELGQKIDSAADRDRHLEQSVQQLGERVARLEARGPDPR